MEKQMVKSKTSLRMKYEAEAQTVRKKLGDLEAIRSSLGLSQRKICQLLLVDPSAWSRWTRPENTAPPHVYRSLQWFLALQEKYPASDAGFWLHTVGQLSQSHEQERRITELEQQLEKLESSQLETSFMNSPIQGRPFQAHEVRAPQNPATEAQSFSESSSLSSSVEEEKMYAAPSEKRKRQQILWLAIATGLIVAFMTGWFMAQLHWL